MTAQPRPSGKTNRSLPPAAGLIWALGLVGGALADRWVSDVPIERVAESRLIGEAWTTIQRHYVDRAVLKPRELMYGAVEGMVDALGDAGHSRFLSLEMVKLVGRIESGQFQGIGAEIQMKGGNVVIVAPLKDSPAERGGLRAGDIILKVNAISVAGMPLEQAVERIAGPVGTPVTLRLMDPQTNQIRDVSLIRAEITIRNITSRPLPGTALTHLRIARFGKGAADGLRKALESTALDKSDGIVLDLRNNPGGLLDEAVACASQFLNGGNVLQIRDAQGQTKPIRVQSGGMARKIPIAVLVNRGSASAAEIVAGALQDAQRARVVGETTFGAGTVLRQFALSDGSALLVAVQEWLTPAGHAIWHKGITPDVVVPLPPRVAPLFPEGEQGLTAARLFSAEDQQLLRAIDLLTPAQPGSSALGH
jgi:carboxyl-terminal processing protease